MLGKQAALGPYLANLGHARDICTFVTWLLLRRWDLQFISLLHLMIRELADELILSNTV